MSLPPLYALRAFESAARLGSFSLAAAELHVTPGAVSRHISTLESWFDCQLFIRRGPKVEVTGAGRLLANELAVGFQSIERACQAFRHRAGRLRLKAPSTLTMRWLLNVLQAFHQRQARSVVDMTSVWMDMDSVDFAREPYDCAVLLGNGQFGADTDSALLFREWLIPVCAPAMAGQAAGDLSRCELIHPSADRRDWRRWLQKTGASPALRISEGKVFDTLEQGNMAAISGHGVSVGDLLLSLDAVRDGLLALPFSQAVATGDGYYLVWPKQAAQQAAVRQLLDFMLQHLPGDIPEGIELLA
ncbi:MAG TPA: LysR substrate-binding domain-containing protein [Enterobacteriaceae bacterium]|nr:LysR substrate-binding domain-containing protein [Enterobacteriaceae bacterium]